jgi:luciferase family oxidoreductase group 1
MTIPYSVLDLAPIVQGGDAARSFRNTLDLARHAERWGYRRYWLAEHHNMPGIASSATAVVIAHVAAGTRTIRVGAGGIMLPNHAPLVIAEQFGTLESLYPGRIDLGVGRAPGTDLRTARALRRDLATNAERFPHDVLELQALLGPAQPHQSVHAVPGTGLNVPIWILGSSLFGAQLAAALGLPFAFASHFAPDQIDEALALYRARFQPSAQLARPHTMAGFNVFTAATDAEARRLFSSLQQQFVHLRRGTPGQLPPPIDSLDGWCSAAERANAERALACSAVGAPDTVRPALAAFIARTRIDEIMITGHIYDHDARLRSFAIAAEILSDLAPGAPVQTALASAPGAG